MDRQPILVGTDVSCDLIEHFEEFVALRGTLYEIFNVHASPVVGKTGFSQCVQTPLAQASV